MSAVEVNLVFLKYKKEGKKYLDKIHQSRLMKSDSNPFDNASFTGNTSLTFRTMVDVCSKCLEEGQTFPD
jgi:hypothetical protein